MDQPARIKALRERLGLTQAALAERLGVSFVSVNRWENGQSRPTPLAWRQIVALEAETGSTRTLRESLAHYRAADTIASVKQPSLTTRAARVGEPESRIGSTAPLADGIYQTTVWSFDDLGAVDDWYEGRSSDTYLYYRNGNPNTHALEQAVA